MQSTVPFSDSVSLILILLGGILVAVVSYVIARKVPVRPFKFPRKQVPRLILGWLLILFALFSLAVVYTGRSRLLSSFNRINRSDSSLAAELGSIPQPSNVRAFGDDQVATISWDPVSGGNVVGYYVTWGKKSEGTFIGSKQTIHSVTQIQPLVNGEEYTVKVQSVQGSYVKKPTVSEQGGSDTYAVANGNLSLPVVIGVTPSRARVDAMRARLTGFFDDFNLSAGGFDETKWNHATTACVREGEDGQFINSQFHAHNMAESTCDRAGNVSRPRGIFDISGRSEENPGQIEFDIDGVTQPRDVWYIDIIPADARKNGMPLDITSHNDLFDADHEDPGRMLRITQYYDHLDLHYYDAANNPHTAHFNSVLCPAWNGVPEVNCSITGKQTGIFSPLAQYNGNIAFFPNVRNHWVIQFSPQKVKLFINGALMFDATTPSLFAPISKYQIHSTLFTYNTGKQYSGIIGPSTSMLHWDNFGFNGPAPTTITHNYIDGGATGTNPLLSKGTKAHPVPSGNRATKIPIPDPIGTPIGQARLMFTIQPFGYSSYSWSSTNSVTINGKVYPVSDPRQTMQNPKSGPLAETYVALSTGVFINPSDLRQGINDIQFNLGSDILNAHIELDYPKDTAPTFTQPRNIFSNLEEAISPVMRANDMYWFVEQTMGLPILSGGTHPSPTSQPSATSTPIPSVSYSIQPAPGYQFVKGSLTIGKALYLNENRFTFFNMPVYLQNIPAVQTSNVDIKEDRNLNWGITLNQRAEVYVLYRKIPNAGVPAWLTDGYTKLTPNDFSNINQFLLRKNEQGLIGLYDIYRTTPNFNGGAQVRFGPASDATNTAFSMYIVGVKPL